MNHDTTSRTFNRQGTPQMRVPKHSRPSRHAHASRPLRAVSIALAAVLSVAACGNQAKDSAEPVSRSTSPTASASPSSNPTAARTASQSPAAKEQITAEGVAALVTEHLGAGKVVDFGTFDEPGTVDLMIRLRGGNRADNFAVTVYSPKKSGGEFKDVTKCPHGKHAKRVKQDRFTKKFTCHRLPNGTTVTAYLTPYGFSDDNARGHVITGVAGAPRGGITMALYESYTRTAPISVTDIDELLSDPRLTWMTDPAVNAAGKSLHVPKLRG